MKTQILNGPYEHLTDFFIEIPQAQISQKTLPNFLSLGRDSSNSIALKDTYISSRHCRIRKKEERFIIEDLQSRNGTFINETQVNEAVIKHGDRIRIGQTEILVKSENRAYPKTHLISKNKKYSKQLEQLPCLAQSDFPVLIIGPTGSGKELLAQEIHRLSLRSFNNLITINCSSFSPSLAESQLFGHLAESFTGATKDKKGVFAKAHGSTLFLDEIGDLPLQVQPKLLRALESQEILPLGANTPFKVNVRIIAATHKNLEEMTNQGTFREDLLYRLKTFKINPPALESRLEDFETLLFQIAKEFKVRFSVNAIKTLKTKKWPGNIRQLRQCIQRASVLFSGQSIQVEHLETLLDEEPSTLYNKSLQDLLGSKKSETPRPVLKQFEKEIIIERLIANNGNQRKTAKELGLAKSTLFDKINSYKKELI